MLCLGCFIVGGLNNVVFDFLYVDGCGFLSIEILLNGLRESICVGFSRGDGLIDVEFVCLCDEEVNVEYEGFIFIIGLFLVLFFEVCCLVCRENLNCNVWTFCIVNDGCGRSEFVYSYLFCEFKYVVLEIIF